VVGKIFVGFETAAADQTAQRTTLASSPNLRLGKHYFDIIFLFCLRPRPVFLPVIEPARGDAQFKNIVRKEVNRAGLLPGRKFGGSRRKEPAGCRVTVAGVKTQLADAAGLLPG